MVSGRLAVAAATALAVVAVAFSLEAQPRRGGRPTRPPPAKPAPTPMVDAGTEGASGDETSNATGDAGAGPTGSALAPVGAVPKPELYDGGLRPSPLNPAPNEFSDGGPPADTIDYDKLLGEIASLRARVAAVGDTLFHSRIAVALEADGGHGQIAHLTIALDDGVVYTAPAGFRAEDATTLYDHAVAPGRHAVSVEVERRDDRDPSFRTTQRSRFVVDVPRDHRLDVRLRIEDDSNMGKNFPGDKSGRYELRVRAKAEARPVGR